MLIKAILPDFNDKPRLKKYIFDSPGQQNVLK
jgi:hypothetical protein